MVLTITMMFREGQARSPTKSERNSGVLEGLVRREVRWFGNPSGNRPNFFGRQHLTFDKMARQGYSAFRGIVIFLKG